MEKDISTEEKIKEVAYRLFQEKGYAATRTRDIANEAGVNLALLNYYFRNKEKLFETVMLSSIHHIIHILSSILNDENTSLAEKIDIATTKYIDVIAERPQLPLFVFGELRKNPELILKKTNIPQNVMAQSVFLRQIKEQIEKENLNLNPFHIILNMVSMSIFPIIGEPLIQHLGEFKDQGFKELIEERKILIPIWVKTILKID